MRPLLLSLCCVWVAGCFYPADRGRALEVKMDRLAADNDRLTAQLSQKIEQKLGQMETALQSLDQASRRSGADIGIQLQKNVEDVAQLRGQVETYLHRIAELEERLQQLGTASAPGATAEAAERRKVEELKRPTDKRAFLALADEKASEGDRVVARQLYNEFLKKWGKDELAGEARFRLGETYVLEDKCREALFEYGKVIQEHPKARSAPSAYLRSSECFQKLKMLDESKLALEELIRQYPKASEVKTAKARLVDLERSRRPAGRKGR